MWYWSVAILFWQLSIGYFRVAKNLTFKTRLSAKPFVVKMSCICIIIKTHFHNNGFALSLALKVTFFGTRKWPIDILWMSNIKDVDLPKHAWDTPPFLFIVSPTPPVPFVDAYIRTYVRSVNHVTTKRKEVDHILWVWGLDFLLQSINAVSIALIEELKDTLKIDTIYDPEQSMEVKSETLRGLTSSTKPHSAEWTLLSAILILQQSMMVYSVGFGFGVCFFGFPFFKCL